MSQNKNIKLTFKAHKNLIDKMHETIKKSGYGTRGKSKWVSEALDELLNMDDYWDLVIEEKPMAKLSDFPESIFINTSLREKLDDGIKKCRSIEPFKQGMQSSILRTAILQRLLKE